MADRTFASLVPRLQPSVPGCPHATIVQYIRNSAIKTCERTLAWRYAEAPYTLTPAVPQYLYRKPEHAEVHAVFLATVNGRPLDRVTLDDAVHRYPEWVDMYGGVSYDQLWQGSGSFNEEGFNEGAFNSGPQFTLTEEALEKASDPRMITQLTPDQFVILPAPDNEREYVLRLIYALKPKRASAGMPATIFDDLEDAIMHGALQEMLVLPNVSWTDRELAAYHAKQYVFHTAERRARANLGNVRGTMTVKMQPFA
jgi:hypothetical protein